MSIIIDRLPETVVIGDSEYKINTDFRVSILFQMMMEDKELSNIEKAKIALELYYPEPIPRERQTEALAQAFLFFKCGQENEDSVSSGGGEGTQAIFSYEHDSHYIFAAFMEQYEIDLTEEDLHWWKFKALLTSLSDNTKFNKIMSYRAVKISSEMSKKEQKFYRRMKLLYALPDERSEEEKESEFAELLGF